MIVAIVQAAAKAGKRAELQRTAEAICHNARGCLEHLYQHPSDENVLLLLSKWTRLGTGRQEGSVGDEVLMDLKGALTPLCDSVEIELHAVSHTTRHETSTSTRAAEVGSKGGATFGRFSKRPNAPELGKPAHGEEEVRIVERYIQAHLDEDLTVADLASAARVSVRTLFRCFRRLRGRSPMKVLETARLEKARKLLLEAREGDRVTRVAMDSGFTHLGRFSVLYKSTYGETPSTTLRRSQQSTRPVDPNAGSSLQDIRPGAISSSAEWHPMDRVGDRIGVHLVQS